MYVRVHDVGPNLVDQVALVLRVSRAPQARWTVPRVFAQKPVSARMPTHPTDTACWLRVLCWGLAHQCVRMRDCAAGHVATLAHLQSMLWCSTELCCASGVGCIVQLYGV